MNIRNVGSNGGIERGGDRPLRTDGKRERSSATTSTSDKAAISSDGREAKAAFDANVDAARGTDGDRAEMVSRALQKLMNGELDAEAVYRDAADRMLAADFRTV